MTPNGPGHPYDAGNIPEPTRGPTAPSDDDLLLQCDSLLSLIRYREVVSATTRRDLDRLLPVLRQRTDDIVATRRSLTLSPEALAITDQVAHLDPLPQPRPWHRDK